MIVGNIMRGTNSKRRKRRRRRIRGSKKTVTELLNLKLDDHYYNSKCIVNCIVYIVISPGVTISKGQRNDPTQCRRHTML